MGISKAIGAVASAFLISYYMLKSSVRLSLLLLYNSVIAFVVTFASHPSINFPLLLGKNGDGKFPIWSKIIFAPFHAIVRMYVVYKRYMRRGKEAAYNEIVDGVYLGGWPTKEKHLPLRNVAVVDCTCELPRSDLVDRERYLCIPVWDTRSPTPVQIDFAVNWVLPLRMQKVPVFVHCAFGHGRSVCMTCALLVALGVAEDWKSAENIVREKRPLIRMNMNHRKNLEEWTKYHHMSKEREVDNASKE